MLNEQQKKYILKIIHGLRVKKGLRSSWLRTCIKKGYTGAMVLTEKDIEKLDKHIEALKNILSTNT